MHSASAPARVLGTFDATCIVVGAIIGVGIFFNPSRVAALTESGTLALCAWALAGAIALCGAVTFAAIGQRYNASGAQYALLRDSYGPCPAFLFVFCNATAIQAGAIGVIALVCAANCLTLAGFTQPSAAVSLAVALALIVVVTLANIAGVKWGARLQNITVAAKVAALLCIVALAAFGPSVDPAAVAPAGAATGAAEGATSTAAGPATKTLSGWSGVVAALVPAFFAYGGWQHALWISGEVREPRRNLPRAILIGMAVVVAVYISANWAYLALLGHAGVAGSKALAADAVATAFPGWGRRAIAAAVAISALGVLNAQLLSGPRLIFGMAADGRFFAPFARLHPRWGTPASAIAMLGAVGAALLVAAGADGIDTLTAGAVFVDGIFFVLTGVALLRMPAGGAHAAAGSQDAVESAPAPLLPGAKLAATIFVLGELGVLIGAFLAADSRHAAWGGLIWIAAAGVVYAAWFRGRVPQK